MATNYRSAAAARVDCGDAILRDRAASHTEASRVQFFPDYVDRLTEVGPRRDNTSGAFAAAALMIAPPGGPDGVTCFEIEIDRRSR
jgi:hypothetical protein